MYQSEIKSNNMKDSIQKHKDDSIKNAIKIWRENLKYMQDSINNVKRVHDSINFIHKTIKNAYVRARNVENHLFVRNQDADIMYGIRYDKYDKYINIFYKVLGFNGSNYKWQLDNGEIINIDNQIPLKLNKKNINNNFCLTIYNNNKIIAQDTICFNNLINSTLK